MYVDSYVFGCLTGVVLTVLSELLLILVWYRGCKKKEYEKEEQKKESCEKRGDEKSEKRESNRA